MLYRQVLAQKSNHAAAAHFLGLLLHQTGRSADGLALLEQSVRLLPNNPDFLNNLGTVMRDIGRVAVPDHFVRATKGRGQRPERALLMGS